MTIAFKKLAPHVGVEILGDPRTEYAAAEVAQLRRLFDEHRVLVFRGHELTAEDQIRLCGYLDTVIEDTPGSIVGWVSNRASQGRLGAGELRYHSDISFCEYPFSGISLFAVELQDDRSSTHFCRVTDPAAWLSDELFARVAGKEVLNLFPQPGRNNAASVPSNTPRFVRPIIGQHPRTGDPVLWANDDYTDSVVGLEASESDALLEEIFAAVYQPEHGYEHSWHNHDLVIWDNVAVHHARGDLRDVGTRTLRRVITGVASIEDQHPGYLQQNPWYGEVRVDETLATT